MFLDDRAMRVPLRTFFEVEGLLVQRNYQARRACDRKISVAFCAAKVAFRSFRGAKDNNEGPTMFKPSCCHVCGYCMMLPQEIQNAPAQFFRLFRSRSSMIQVVEILSGVPGSEVSYFGPHME